MKRRDFTAGLLLASVTRVRAQERANQHRIAIIIFAGLARIDDPRDRTFQAFWEELRRLGDIEGQNHTVERYSGEGRPASYADLAREVVNRNPDVIVATTSPVARAVRTATGTIPIVWIGGDPIQGGLAASLAHPGGNITGVTVYAGYEDYEIYGKRLQILKQAVPSASKVGFLDMRPSWEGGDEQGLREVGRRSEISVIGMPLDESTPAEYQRVFGEIAKQRPDAIMTHDLGEVTAYHRLIVDLVERSRLPAIYGVRQYVEVGGLMAYMTDFSDLGRRMADDVHEILNGAKPGDIPIYQPTKFEFLINLQARQGTGPHYRARTASDRRRGDRMRRRDFIAVICGTWLVLPVGAAAEQPGKVWRIGDVLTAPPERGAPFAQALEQSLADLGYIQGRNIVLLHRFAGAQVENLEEAVISLVPQVDLLVVWGNAAMPAKRLAGGVPTVFISIGFPVEVGLVQSLAHPGGNMTGIAAEAALEINGKRLQILKEIVPGLDRVAVLRDAADRSFLYASGLEWTALDQAARELGLTLVPADIKSADELETAFADMKKSGAQALFVTRTALLANAGKQIADLAISTHLPSSCPFRSQVIAGGLVSLDADRLAMTRPAAAQIDKIVKGASPADIPVEQPTKFDLYVNLKTARLLDLTIPPSLLALADKVIE